MTRLQFEAATSKKPLINFCGSELEESSDSDETDNIVMKLKEQLAIKEEMLNEAVIDYHNKTEEMNKVQQEKEILNKEFVRASASIAELQVIVVILFVIERALISISFLSFIRLSWREVICYLVMPMSVWMFERKSW